MGQKLDTPPYYVREAGEFEPEGDHIICRWNGTEWAMSPAVAQLVSANLQRALVEWQKGSLARVLEFPPREH